MARDLTDKVIIITGASSGIGEATAIRCAAAGMDVVLNARREGKLHAVAQRIRDLGREAVIVVGDVTDPGTSERLLDAAIDRFGRFDVVFANAGYGLQRPVLDVAPAEHRRIFEVNFFAALDLLQRAARRLIQQQRPGYLLMCSSCVAKFTLPFYGPYSATKAAQNLACRAMRIELKAHGIEVSSVHPIATATEFSEVAGRHNRALAAPHDLATPPPAIHAPRGFVQSSDRVARAVVRGLRRPRPELWTSVVVRFSAALFTLWPSLCDVAMRRVRRVITSR